MNRKKVAVGISGGVDSAVSALLLKEAGFNVVGVHLYCWPPKSEIERDGITREEWIKKNGCRVDEDRDSALKTALEIGIPFKTLDFSEEYNERVIKYFYEEYEAGRTPNPDVLCNSEIKFGLFLDWALENGFDAIATGHYASLKGDLKFAESSTHAYLSRDARMDMFRAVSARTSASHSLKLVIPKDKHKDQTYFLWKLTEKELKYVLFPLGNYLKSEVRVMAKKAGLSVANKKDSQGICFVGNVEVREFLKRRLLEKPGEVVDMSGAVVGKHNGVAFYTIGERGGWEMNPVAQKRLMKGGETKPLFIVDKNSELNRLIVGDKKDVMCKKLVLSGVNLISQSKDEDSIEFLKTAAKVGDLFVRIRHGGELFEISSVEGDRSKLVVETSKDIFGVASGQSAVLYSKNGECLGGGMMID